MRQCFGTTKVVTLAWISEHRGIPGNENVDEFAKLERMDSQNP